MTKRIFGITSLMIILILSGCGTMMLMLGDNQRYTISGKVQSIPSNKTENTNMSENRIHNAVVKLECKGIEKSLYQNKATITDESGYYKLSGYWSLDGCVLILSHNNYKTKVLTIDNTYITNSRGLLLKYEANVTLENIL